MNLKPAYGLIGYPVKHSLSALMHNAAFKDLRIDAHYELFEVAPQDLADFLLNRTDVTGFNITVPHKVKAKEILDKAYPDNAAFRKSVRDEYYVQISGAINTVKRHGSSVRYYNTDVGGFLTSLEIDLKFDPNGKTVLILGCGGAGRAIAAGLTYWDEKNKKIPIEKMYIYEPSKEAADSAKQQFSHLPDIVEFIGLGDVPQVIRQCQLLINASPLGMKENSPSPIGKRLLQKGLFVYDVVYNRDTRLLQDARDLDLAACGGLGMLLYQGAAAFEIWTGRKPPIPVMRRALIKGAGL